MFVFEVLLPAGWLWFAAVLRFSKDGKTMAGDYVTKDPIECSDVTQITCAKGEQS